MLKAMFHACTVPDGHDVRLELRNPVRELHHLEILAVLLQLRGANPERVGDQAAKAAEHLRRERQHGRRILQRLQARDADGRALAIEHRQQEPVDREQRGGESEQERIFWRAGSCRVTIECSLAASSRRVNMSDAEQRDHAAQHQDDLRQTPRPRVSPFDAAPGASASIGEKPSDKLKTRASLEDAGRSNVIENRSADLTSLFVHAHDGA